MSNPGYSFKVTNDNGEWYSVQFEGPGISRHSPTVPLRHAEGLPNYHADHIARLLAIAFEAGRQAKAREVREAFGIYKS